MSLEVTPHHFHFVQLVGRKPRSPAHTEGSTFSKEDQSIFFTSVVRLVEHNTGPGSFPSLYPHSYQVTLQFLLPRDGVAFPTPRC